MQDFSVFISVFAFFFIFYYGAHSVTINKNKFDVPNLI
ncbi:hypothetical protein NCAS_0E03130 [Naumovozyma castellii]|uniref:Uncharacterized protein n=1 Tax=Naumovozyma castellii TaxID=27288 RepID=G0VFW4_NAUCA|nr:hypothetical protein NCAS_0E03130 [Naumovozyma castellii CBS 4309]CCC70383.1 hypothetical protein NCAS_0E03130 [Naumovozyma castellii CBS 4309]